MIEITLKAPEFVIYILVLIALLSVVNAGLSVYKYFLDKKLDKLKWK